MRRRYLLLGLSLILGGLYFYIDDRDSGISSPLWEHSDAQQEPDYYGEQLLNLQYNQAGLLEKSLKAQGSKHYPHTATSHFTQPQLTSRDSKGQLWQLTAQQGQMHDDTQTVLLEQQVEIQPLNTVPSEQILVETEQLAVDLQSKIANTEHDVRITRPDGIITAQGMTLSLSEQTLELHQQVKTQYANPAR